MQEALFGPREIAKKDELPLAVAIPLYNEEQILMEKLEELSAVFNGLVGAGNWFFILVVNGCTDATPQIVEEAIARWPLSRRVDLVEPNYGAALRAGLIAVDVKWVFQIDIEQWEIPFIAWSWKNRDAFDVFCASKRGDPTINHQAPYRKLLSSGLNGVLQLLFDYSGTDTHGGKLINCQTMRPIYQICTLDRGHFDTEMMLRAIRGQKRVVEVPVAYREYRPQRNWMFKKIIWNVLALRRLVRVMRDVPFEGPIRYYRFAREDVLADQQLEAGAPTELDLV